MTSLGNCDSGGDTFRQQFTLRVIISIFALYITYDHARQAVSVHGFALPRCYGYFEDTHTLVFQ